LLIASPATTSRATIVTLEILDDLLGEYHPRDFATRLWDGTMVEPDPDELARFTLVLNHPGTLRAILHEASDLALGEGYIFDDFDIEGDIHAIFPLGDYLVRRGWGINDKLRIGRHLMQLPRHEREQPGRSARVSGHLHSRERDQQAIAYHYDLSNDFYRLWLDRHLVYSCAYFRTPDDSLERAQEQKLDILCRKLRLQPGERLLDIGCGWGGLLIHAAQHYGVVASGITLSREQAELANQRIHEAGLERRVQVYLRDYRDLDEPEGFDKIVSVGMFEHVGASMLGAYFRQAWRLLRPGGVFLNHGIARSVANDPRHGPTFVSRYVFPDGELLPINETARHAEQAGFEVRDIESLREHYALTLRQWVERLEAHHDEAVRIADEQTYRIWRLYMAGSAWAFEQGRINLYQTLLAKPNHGETHLPLTREDWYR
jgi:cyclopropane-fatty-acyl-phospholipid synthase